MDFEAIFFEELNEKLKDAEEALRKYLENQDILFLKDLYRIFHTIKGSASLVGFQGFQRVTHKIEDMFKDFYENKKTVTQQDTARLLKVISIFKTKTSDLEESEIEKLENFLEGKIDSLEENASEAFLTPPLDESHGYYEILESIIRVENNLILNNQNLALVELKNLKKYINDLIQRKEFIGIDRLIEGFDNLVFQESILNNKKVKFVMDCQDLRIPIRDAKVLKDALIHIVKNSIAHGIETPEERKKLGKTEEGIVKLSAYLNNETITIVVEDDGTGIDLDKIKGRAENLGYKDVDPVEALFYPNLSTKDSSDISSGRGMGLYSAKMFIEEKGGRIRVETKKGKGTKFILEIPVVSVLKKIMILKSNGNIFAIDLSEILFVLSKPEVLDLGNSSAIRYGDNLYKLIGLSSKKLRFGILLKNNQAITVDEIVGIFDGQLIQQSIGISKYFVKNIFPFPIPVLNLESMESVKKTEKTSTSNKHVVLVVDDSPVTRLVIQHFLENHGYNVIQAKDGIDALNKKGFDAAIVDVEMPKMDGYETTKKLKEKYPDIPVIILSTKSSDEDIKKGLDSGANAYLIKGENLERVLQLLDRFLKR